MTAGEQRGGPAGAHLTARARSVSALVRARRRFALLVAALVVYVLVLDRLPRRTPIGALVLLVVVAAFALPRRLYRCFAVLVAAATVLMCARLGGERPDFVWSGIVVAASLPLMAVLLRPRHELGMTGSLPENLLIEVRSRLTRSTALPAVPDGWGAEVSRRPAHGVVFGGDFVVSARDGDRFEVALVDVSGNGLDAAARATQLIGALGALVGAVPAAEFMGRANDYVLRQRWDDGYATLLHLEVDLRSGWYSLGRAGHPAPVLWEGASRWSFIEGAAGTPLGVLPDTSYPRLSGILRPGDGLVAYSDGVVESRSVSGVEGTERFRRVVRSAVRLGAEGAAERICSAAPSAAEDRTVVTVWRREPGV